MAEIKYFLDLDYVVDENPNISLTVNVISNLNSVVTDPSISKIDDEQIMNSGSIEIAKSVDLIGKELVWVSSVVNSFANEDRIIIDYLLNGKSVKKVDYDKNGKNNWTLIFKTQIKEQ